MAAPNKRKQETSFTLKDVLVVISAMLTAIAPLIANDVRIHSLQTDVTTLSEQTKEAHEDLMHMREDIKELSHDSVSNQALLKQMSQKEDQADADRRELDNHRYQQHVKKPVR